MVSFGGWRGEPPLPFRAASTVQRPFPSIRTQPAPAGHAELAPGQVMKPIYRSCRFETGAGKTHDAKAEAAAGQTTV